MPRETEPLYGDQQHVDAGWRTLALVLLGLSIVLIVSAVASTLTRACR